jgi:putative transcriptional regulator
MKKNISDVPVAAPTHHPAGELLIDYAAGNLSEAETMLIALHLDYCSECRGAVQVALKAGGALLDAIEPMALPPSAFQRALQAIDAAPVSIDSVIRSAPTFAVKWPAALRERLAAAPARPWRKMPAGFRALRVPFQGESERVWVMDAPGGRWPLSHAHLADEWTVVLEGGFSDETGTYAAGDFAYMGPGDRHTMVAEEGEGCVCVLLIREQPRYLTFLGKLLAPLLRL